MLANNNTLLNYNMSFKGHLFIRCWIKSLIDIQCEIKKCKKSFESDSKPHAEQHSLRDLDKILSKWITDLEMTGCLPVKNEIAKACDLLEDIMKYSIQKKNLLLFGKSQQKDVSELTHKQVILKNEFIKGNSVKFGLPSAPIKLTNLKSPHSKVSVNSSDLESKQENQSPLFLNNRDDRKNYTRLVRKLKKISNKLDDKIKKFEEQLKKTEHIGTLAPPDCIGGRPIMAAIYYMYNYKSYEKDHVMQKLDHLKDLRTNITTIENFLQDPSINGKVEVYTGQPSKIVYRNKSFCALMGNGLYSGLRIKNVVNFFTTSQSNTRKRSWNKCATQKYEDKLIKIVAQCSEHVNDCRNTY